MRNDELTYDWLDFLAEQKSAARSIKEIKASQTNPKAADMFGNYEYEMASGDSIKITNNPPPMGTAKLFCTAQNKVIQKVQFHAKFIADLEKAYREGSTRYCPMSAGGFKARKVRNKNSLKLPPEQRSLSNHSFGAAIDFNPGKNPFRKGFTSEVEKYPEFIQAFERNGFTWLGDGAGRQGPGHPGDDMHFEIRVDGEALNIAVDDKAEADTSGGASGNKLADFYGRFGPTGQPQTIQSPQQQNTKATLTAESINNEIFKIVDKTEEKIYKKYKKYFESLLNHLKKELKITKSVKIVFEDDKENSKKVLGRTGGYLNEESKIHIFTTGRHVKDIMRSLSHEMVHHRQNIRGEFEKAEPTENGYAQKNPHLRKMEKEAFLKGNMLFRDWEDNYKYRGEK